MKRFIEVTGTGIATKPADQVRINLTLTEQSLDYAKVLAGADKQLSELLTVLKELKVADNVLKTTNYSLNTYYEQDPAFTEYRTKFAGYRLSHGLELCFPQDHERLTELFSALTGLAGKPEFYLTFGLSSSDHLQSVARERAVSDATHKADELAQASGLTLGKILRIKEVTSGFDAPMRKLSFAQEDRAVIPAGEHDVVQSLLIRFQIA